MQEPTPQPSSHATAKATRSPIYAHSQLPLIEQLHQLSDAYRIESDDFAKDLANTLKETAKNNKNLIFPLVEKLRETSEYDNPHTYKYLLHCVQLLNKDRPWSKNELHILHDGSFTSPEVTDLITGTRQDIIDRVESSVISIERTIEGLCQKLTNKNNIKQTITYTDHYDKDTKFSEDMKPMKGLNELLRIYFGTLRLQHGLLGNKQEIAVFPAEINMKLENISAKLPKKWSKKLKKPKVIEKAAAKFLQGTFPSADMSKQNSPAQTLSK